MGLFDTPDQIRQAQQAQLMQQYRAGDMVGAAAAGLGNTLTKAAGHGLFDIDPRSKEEIQAQKQQELLKSTDFSDFDSVMRASKRLQDTNPEASISLVNHANSMPAITTEEVKWGPPTGSDGKVIKGLEGMFVPTTTTVQKKGSRVLSKTSRMGGALETMDRLIARTRTASKPTRDRREGNIRTPEGEVYQVYMGLDGPYAIDRDGSHSKELFNKHAGTLFSAREDNAIESSLFTKIDIKNAQTAVEELTSSKGFWGPVVDFFTQMSEEDQTNVALSAVAEANDKWRKFSPELKKEFGNKKENYIRSLMISDLQSRGEGATLSDTDVSDIMSRAQQ